MGALQERLVDHIRSAGPMPFAAYMARALYDPVGGYYASGEVRTGRRGDYMTSPELDDAYAALWSRAFVALWRSWGEPERFTIVEIGGGEGTFARGVLESLEGAAQRAFDYVLVERTPAVEERQRAALESSGRVSWARSLEAVSAPVGCLFANEVLDNLPVHVIERRGGELLEVYVAERNGTLVEQLGPPSSPALLSHLGALGISLEDGQRAEAALALGGFISTAARALGRGAFFFVDYGLTAPELARRSGGTLVCYSVAGADDLPLERPGEKDITAHVNWTAVSAACAGARLDVGSPVSQREVLSALGLRELDAHLRREHDEAIAEGRGADAVRALSRRHALASLADPGGLGGLGVMTALKAASIDGPLGVLFGRK